MIRFIVAGKIVYAIIFLFHSAFCNIIDSRLAQTINSVNRALDFLNDRHQNLNLDSLLGTRITEAQLKVLKNHLEITAGHPGKSFLDEIEHCQAKAGNLSSLVIPIVARLQSQYYEHIGGMLTQDFWALSYSARDVDKSLVIAPAYEGEALNESVSDMCLADLLGSGTNKRKCDFTNDCWRLMTAPGYRGYSLSHELIYLMVMERMKCVASDMRPSIYQMYGEFCANLYDDVLDIARRRFPLQDRDFFMEATALCGMAGFKQFFKWQWQSQMLRWQRSNGCWGVQHNMYTRASRLKREERTFEDGCQCHRTAVAISALGQYVRYIIEFIQPLNW